MLPPSRGPWSRAPCRCPSATGLALCPCSAGFGRRKSDCALEQEPRLGGPSRRQPGRVPCLAECPDREVELVLLLLPPRRPQSVRVARRASGHRPRGSNGRPRLPAEGKATPDGPSRAEELSLRPRDPLQDLGRRCWHGSRAALLVDAGCGSWACRSQDSDPPRAETREFRGWGSGPVLGPWLHPARPPSGVRLRAGLEVGEEAPHLALPPSRGSGDQEERGRCP